MWAPSRDGDPNYYDSSLFIVLCLNTYCFECRQRRINDTINCLAESASKLMWLRKGRRLFCAIRFVLSFINANYDRSTIRICKSDNFFGDFIASILSNALAIVEPGVATTRLCR